MNTGALLEMALSRVTLAFKRHKLKEAGGAVVSVQGRWP